MSIYIKGLDMPKSCHDCEMCTLVDVSDGLAYGCRVLKEMISNDGDRLTNCPIFPIPPHGRLIDADSLEYHADNVRDPMGRTEKTVMWKKIEAASTIIPAEENT